jgi:hypothetical protein
MAPVAPKPRNKKDETAVEAKADKPVGKVPGYSPPITADYIDAIRLVGFMPAKIMTTLILQKCHEDDILLYEINSVEDNIYWKPLTLFDQVGPMSAATPFEDIIPIKYLILSSKVRYILKGITKKYCWNSISVKINGSSGIFVGKARYSERHYIALRIFNMSNVPITIVFGTWDKATLGVKEASTDGKKEEEPKNKQEEERKKSSIKLIENQDKLH